MLIVAHHNRFDRDGAGIESSISPASLEAEECDARTDDEEQRTCKIKGHHVSPRGPRPAPNDARSIGSAAPISAENPSIRRRGPGDQGGRYP